jgi:hypothetical protein
MGFGGGIGTTDEAIFSGKCVKIVDFTLFGSRPSSGKPMSPGGPLREIRCSADPGYTPDAHTLPKTADDLSGLSHSELGNLSDWRGKFNSKYPIIGRIVPEGAKGGKGA